MMFTCTSSDQQTRSLATDEVPGRRERVDENWQCRQVIWHDYNLNYYVYSTDSSRLVTRCTAVEKTNSFQYYPLEQRLVYNRQGLLEQVYAENGSSQYHYRNGQLASIDFRQAKRLIYRYLISVNAGGQIIGLRGIPLNNSGLMGYSTRYQLDQQGRYVQLDVRTDKGLLYYRVVQDNFDTSTSSIYGLLRGIPFDLNRHAWINWGEGFPVSQDVARHIRTYQYAAPQTPDQLIKRSDVSASYRTNTQGYLTHQYRTDAVSSLHDTVWIDYRNCR
ncbi:hypothetical protein [Spirosoma koreense]